MRKHFNKRNERLFNRLIESMSANTSINEMEDQKDIETIIGNYNLSDVEDVLNCMERLIGMNPENPQGLKVLYQQVAARKQEEEQGGGSTVMVDTYNDILTKIPAYLASKEEWVNKVGDMTQTEKWLSSEIVSEPEQPSSAPIWEPTNEDPMGTPHHGGNVFITTSPKDKRKYWGEYDDSQGHLNIYDDEDFLVWTDDPEVNRDDIKAMEKKISFLGLDPARDELKKMYKITQDKTEKDVSESEQPSRLRQIYNLAHKKWETDGAGEWDENELESELQHMLSDKTITQEDFQAVLDAYNMQQRK